MSDLPASSLGYQAVVAEYFLGLRGAGLMISPLDAELVAEWERRGIPVAVVCRGLRRGLETAASERAPAAPLPRSLRALRLAVEDEWRAYQGGRVGAAPAPPPEARVAQDRLEAARALLLEAGRVAGGSVREGYRAAWRILRAGAAGGGTPLERIEAALAEADATIVAAWVRSLEPASRSALGPRLRLRAGPRARGASREAYRQSLRAHLLDAAREAGLTCLRGSV